MSQVLDASAVLAYLHQEPGWEVVRSVIDDARIGAVNWSEVAQKTVQQGLDIDLARALLTEVGMDIVPFSADHAESAARLGKKQGSMACPWGIAPVWRWPLSSRP